MINPFEYYKNLETAPVKKQGSFIDFSELKPMKGQVIIDNTPYYKKSYYGLFANDLKKIVSSMTSTELFHQIDFYSPPIFVSTNTKFLELIQLSQSITSVPDFQDATIAFYTDFFDKLADVNKSEAYLKYAKAHAGKYNQILGWLPLYDSEIKALFMKYMTPKCFDEYISMFLVDILRTEKDRHESNYLLYKNKNSDKYDGVIPIDMDDTEIQFYFNHQCDEKKSIFNVNTLPGSVYYSYTPLCTTENKPHKKKLLLICKLLQDGVLSDGNIKAIRTALGFDMGKTIKEIGKKYGLSEEEIKQMYTSISYLWDYNRETLGSELGL